MAMITTDSTADAILKLKARQTKANKRTHKKTGEQVLTDDLAAAAVAGEQDAAIARPGTGVNALLEEVQQDWIKRHEEEGRIAQQEADGTRVIHLADAGSNGLTMTDAGKSLTGGAEPAAEAAATSNAAVIPAAATTMSPALIAVLGGVAIAATGGGSGAAATLAAAVVTDGIVIDGPVKNVLVFRDSDGDGNWFDADGDGVWDSGDEYIVTTGDDGRFTDLGGTGQIVSVGLDKLLSNTAHNGPVTKIYTAADTITDTNGHVTTGSAIDTGTGLPFTGIFVAPGVAVTANETGGDSYTITGVSTLVAHMLEAAGLPAPTVQQVIDYSEMLNQLLNTTYDGGVINSGAETIDFFTSGANEQIIALLNGIAAQAEATGNDPAAAIEVALLELADELVNGDTYDSEDPIDLSDPDALGAIFDGLDASGEEILVEVTDESGDIIEVGGIDLDTVHAAALAGIVTGGAASSSGSIWYEPAGSESSTEVIAQASDITVISSVASSDVSLDVSAADGAATELYSSTIGVIAAADNSTASLTLAGQTETDPDVVVDAIHGIAIQAIGYGTLACADLILSGVTEITDGISIITGACADYAYATASISGDAITVAGDITVAASAASSDASLTLGSNGSGDTGIVTFDHTLISVTASGYYASADLNAWNTTGSIDGIAISASGENSYAAASVSGNITVGSAVTVEASDSWSDAELSLNSGGCGDMVTFDHTLISVTASGYDTYTSLDAYNTTGTIDGISVTASGFSSSADVYIEGDVSVNGDITATASNRQSEVSIDLNGVAFDGATINIAASSQDTYAHLDASNASGTINGISVTTSGESADYAYATASISGDAITVAGDITIAASVASSDASLTLGSNGSGDTGIVTFDHALISVTASGYSSDARLDAWNASGDIAGISVMASGYESSTDVHIQGAVNISGDVTVTASGQYSTALLDLNGVAFDGAMINVTASSSDAYASLDVYGVTGTINGISVLTSAYSASADVNIAGDVAVSGDIIVTASGTSAEAYLNLNGIAFDDASINITASSYSAYASFDASNASGTINGISVTASDDNANSTASISGDITIVGAVTVEASAASSNASLTLGSNDSGDTFDAAQINVTASNYNTGAYLYAYNTTGTLSSVAINASGNNAYARGNSIDFSGTLAGDILVSASGSSADARLNMESSVVDTTITLGADTDLTVLVSGFSSETLVNLDNLTGTLDTLTVNATGGSSNAWAAVRFDAGQVNHVVMEAAQIDDYASAYISQTAYCGDVTVSGDGWATLGLENMNVQTINLSALHDDAWGVFNLELSAADGSYGCADIVALTNNMVTVSDFSLERDSINITHSSSDLQGSWMQDNYNYETVHYAENEADAGSFVNFLAAADTALTLNSDDVPDYYFGVVGADGYLAYDMDGTGITGIIKLEGVTSFDEINVADRQSSNWSGDISTVLEDPMAITDLYYSSNWSSSSADITYTAARIEGLHFSAYSSDTNLSINAQTNGSGDVIGSLYFRQAVIGVSADMYSSADLIVNDATGTIDQLWVTSNSSSDASATFNNFVGAVHEISVSANKYSSADITIGGLTDSVHNQYLNASSSDVTANLTFAAGYVVSTDINLVTWNNNTSVTLSIDQAEHGGEVFASAYNWGGGGINLNLTYQDETADKIYLGYLSADTTFISDFDGQFNLTLNAADANIADNAALQASMLQIWGFDGADPGGDDTLNFGGNSGGYSEDLAAAANLDAFLATANTALDGATDYYFGTVGGDGYLAYDQEGTGITLLLEFHGMTDFDPNRIVGAVL